MWLLQAIYQSARLPVPSFTGLIKIFELSYGNMSDWLDYPSFYENASSLRLTPRT
jgi:hypothetical protein